jgi:pimeloyl-ACP methyl ester carboxylesterase
MFFYQVPIIPELLFEANDFVLFGQLFYAKPMGLINRNNMTSDELEVFKYTFSQKGKYRNYLIFIDDFFIINSGTAKAAINYYRAIFRNQKDEFLARITVPVLIVWGCKDAALGEELADASLNYCNNVQLKKIQNASHWVQQDTPDEVNKYVEDFLKEKS